jgi:hypothetical protein
MIQMSNKNAKVITEAKIGKRKVVAQMAPLIGDSEVNLICGNCRTMLIKGYSAAKYPDVVVRCINCGSYNEA